MASREILIQIPEINREPHRYLSYVDNGLSRTRFKQFCEAHGLTPEASPRVCDLFAGAGAMGKIMQEEGWNPRKMMCIDQMKPDSNELLIKGAKWLYWDLREVAMSLVDGDLLPPEVSVHKGKFDIVTMAYSVVLPREWEVLLARFFAKHDNGVFIVPSDWDWQHLGNIRGNPYLEQGKYLQER